MDRGGPFLCRDCGTLGDRPPAERRCPSCGSPRLVVHDELQNLSMAHVDCDSFYASIEKRDRPQLRDRPVIVGGEQRGVVATCCYIARQSGVRSAMPSATARRLCPDAVFIKPDMAKYVAASRQIRGLMDALTPLVEPLSIDEAFLDLSGTQKLHGGPPAQILARFARDVEREVGVTVSVGLSHNKFLAKIASDLDKPRGFALIGEAETQSFLAEKPISIIYGVGKVFTKTLASDGLTTIGQLQQSSREDLIGRYGQRGAQLHRLAHGRDARPVQQHTGTKSVSSETTFSHDIADFEQLCTRLLGVCEHLSARLKQKNLVGDTITLKLKSSGFRTRTRARQISLPTQLAHQLYETARPLLAREADGTAYRLIGVGVSGLVKAEGPDPVDLVEPAIARRSAAERAIDKLRGKFGDNAVVRGRLFRPPPQNQDQDKAENTDKSEQRR